VSPPDNPASNAGNGFIVFYLERNGSDIKLNCSMDKPSIIDNIKKHITLGDKEECHFLSLLVKKEVKKKEMILQEGEPCEVISYVSQGVLRAYYRDRDLNESIIMFAIHDWWVTDMYSFSSGKPAMLNIDALETSTIFQLKKNDLDNLFVEIPAFEKFFRIMMQNAYVREQLRIIQNLSMPAEERYLNFLEKYPQFASRVPLKQIASYLGITPEFLSVLRKKFSQKDIS
jgi:CRP-like cAMP-binding protein